MKISCPHCGTRFSVPDQALGTTGRTLKCARCGHRWHQDPISPQSGTASPPPRPAAGDHGPLSEHLEGPAPPHEPVPEPASTPPDPPRSDREPSPDPPVGRGRTLLDDPLDPLADDLPMTSEPVGARPAGAADSAGLDDEGPDFDDILARLERQERERSGRDKDLSYGDTDRFGDDDELPGLLRGGGKEWGQGTGRGKTPAWASWLAAALIVVAGALGALYFLRDSVVGLVPQTEGVYTALGISLSRPGLGLKLENVVPTREIVDEEEILVVRGFITNVSEIDRPVPALSLTLNNADGEMVQRMVSPAPTNALTPGQTTSFRLTMRNRLPEAVAIEVAFTDRPAEPIMSPPGAGAGG